MSILGSPMIKNILSHQVQSKLDELDANFCIVLPDGKKINAQRKEGLTPTLMLTNWITLSHLAHGEIGLVASDWVEGKLYFDGNMRELMDLAAQVIPFEPNQGQISMLGLLGNQLEHWRGRLRHRRAQSKLDVQSHYDVTDDFFSTWLDEQKVYSCAYFEDDGSSLQAAQKAKLDLICRKLSLQANDRFLDVGMGWGALLFWAAENYGVQAQGITLSVNQFEYVQRQIDAKGLSRQIKVRLLDYRDLDESEPFDKIASVGMFEHVGRANMSSYFEKIYRLLSPGGMVMNHGITANGTGYRQLGLGIGDFIEKYIFPGGELIHLSEVCSHMAQSRLELVDAECLRPHYAKTLWAWSDRLESRLNQARAALSRSHGEQTDRILRAYRLYLAGCAMGFERGWTSIYQILALRPSQTPLYPYRREHMYAR